MNTVGIIWSRLINNSNREILTQKVRFMKRITLLLAFLVMSLGMAMAQSQVEVSGTVTSAEDGQPIIGATVRGKTSKKGARTNPEGKFKFTVPQDEKVLIVSFVGMQTREVAVGKNLKIVLQPEATALGEVEIAVAYGTAKRESMVGAQANVSAKQLEVRPLTNVTTALNGAAPGIQVTTSSGQPGASADVMIRGFGSINASSSPLYIVDGAVYNGAIGDIAPSDIQSLSILKDAASTSLYGSSAGNGVILITTKSGSFGGQKNKPSISVNISHGWSRRGAERYETVGAMDYYPLLWQQFYNDNHYTRGMTPEQAGYWANYQTLDDLKYNPYAGIQTGAVYNGKTKTWGTSNDPAEWHAPLIVTPEGKLNPEITGLLWADDLDWEKALFRTGNRSDYNISGSYGNDMVKSFMSLGYLKEEGYRVMTSLERFSARSNVSYTPNKWFSLGSNINVSRSNVEEPNLSSGSYASNSFDFISRVAPIYPIHVHKENGEYELDAEGNKIFDYDPNRPFRGKYNPIMQSTIDLTTVIRDAMTSRSFIAVNILPELKFTANISYDVLRRQTKERLNNIMGDQPDGTLEIEDDRYLTVTYNQLLNYNKTFGDHSIDALLGHESYEYEHKNVKVQKKGMGLLGYDEMDNLAEVTEVKSGTTPYRKEGYFGRFNYEYKNRYNVSLSYRHDGSSRFAKNRRWGNFWSIGGGWNVHREEFMSDLNWIDMLKIRASYGETGNDALSGYFPYTTLYALGRFNGNSGGVALSSYGNPDLVWEAQSSYDLAIEFGLWNRLRGAVELFNKESKDLLFQYPLPLSSGVDAQDRNIGKIRNYGVEVDLKYTILNTNDFNWEIAGNATFLRNKILTLPEANRENGIEVADYYKYVEGRSRYEFFLNEWIGVDPEDGVAMYRIDEVLYPDQANPQHPSFAGVGKTGEEATWTKDGRFAKKHFAGSSIPAMYGGFSTSASWKGLDFSLAFSYQLGGKTFDGFYRSLMGRRLNSGNAMHKDMLNAWRTKGQVTDVPRLDAGDAGRYDALSSDRFLISSDALMLKSVVLGYSLPKKLVSKVGLGSARVSLAGENLFLWSKRKGLNPMMNYTGVTGAARFDYSKVITTSLSLTF